MCWVLSGSANIRPPAGADIILNIALAYAESRMFIYIRDGLRDISVQNIIFVLFYYSVRRNILPTIFIRISVFSLRYETCIQSTYNTNHLAITTT